MKTDRTKIRELFKGIDRDALTAFLGSSRNTIDQVAGGHIGVSLRRAKQIERFTQGKIPASVYYPELLEE